MTIAASDQVPVYCFASPEQRTYEAAKAAHTYWWKVHNRQHKHLDCRDHYSATGFTMAEVVGMQFINLHTLNVGTVVDAGLDRFGHWGMLLKGNLTMTKGVWWGNRFVLDDDLRWDWLTPEEQYGFVRARVQYCYRETGRAEEDYQKADNLNRNHKKKEWQRRKTDLQESINAMGVFAAQHSFNVDIAEINASVAGTEAKPIQLRLF